jgi:hypothetical protein
MAFKQSYATFSRGWVAPGPAALLAGALSILAGAGVAFASPLAAASIGVIVLAFLLEDARVRVAFITVGGVLVLQSSEALTPVKACYLAGVAVSVGIAALTSGPIRQTEAYQLMRPLLWASGGLLSLTIASLPISVAQGTSAVDWLRGAAPYLLLSSVPTLALDIRFATSGRHIRVLFIIVGCLSAVGFVVKWVSERGFADLPLVNVALPSLLLVGALFSFAVSSSVNAERRRALWGVFALIIVGALLMTGTRVTAIFLVVPVVVLLVSAWKSGTGPVNRRVVGAAMTMLLAVIAVSALIAVSLQGSGSAVFARLATTQNLLVSPQTDLSYQERAAQLAVASKTFQEHLLVGAGPGNFFEWLTSTGVVRRSNTIDSGLSFPAKFGLFGLVIGAWLALAYGRFVFAALKGAPEATAAVALAGLLSLVLLSLPLTSPFEDKGVAFGLMLLLALCLPERQAPRRHASKAAGFVHIRRADSPTGQFEVG